MNINVNGNSNVGLVILIVVIAIIVLIFIRKHFKKIVLPNLFLVSGAVKSGKTLLSVHLAIKQYKKNLRMYNVRKFFLYILGQKNSVGLPPMLYSNIPLAKVKYNILTADIIFQEVRIPEKSVVLIDEISLLADSFLFNDVKINNALMRFCKLFAHYSHGGTLIVDTQSVADCHFALRRCIGSFLYIYSRVKLPFISILQVREMAYSDTNNIISVSNSDIELEMRKIIILNSTYRKYDCYCYSSFTDYKKFKVCYSKDIKSIHDDLKVYKLVSFQNFAKEINEEMDKVYKPVVEVINKEEGVNNEKQ